MSLTADQKQRCKTTFDFFDKNKNGSIDKTELREALNKLGDFSELDVTSILNEADVDKSGGIEFDEFCKFVAPRLLKVPPPANEIKAAFDKYDKNKDGFLGADEVISLARDLGFGAITIDQAKTMISIVDDNNDGKISFEEFKRLVINK